MLKRLRLWPYNFNKMVRTFTFFSPNTFFDIATYISNWFCPLLCDALGSRLFYIFKGMVFWPFLPLFGAQKSHMYIKNFVSNFLWKDLLYIVFKRKKNWVGWILSSHKTPGFFPMVLTCDLILNLSVREQMNQQKMYKNVD